MFKNASSNNWLMMIDLDSAYGGLRLSLGRLENEFSKFRFDGRIEQFRLTPDKPNTARTSVPVKFEGKHFGNMAVVMFQPGDGTGNFDRCQPGSLTLPLEYVFTEKPERVFPRVKSGLAEGYFPLFSQTSDGICLYGVGCLDILTVIPTEQRLVKCWGLGNGLGIFRGHISSQKSLSSIQPQFTYRNTEPSFGNPHAIFYGARTIAPALQIAGFLEINNNEQSAQKLMGTFDLPSKQW